MPVFASYLSSASVLSVVIASLCGALTFYLSCVSCLCLYRYFFSSSSPRGAPTLVTVGRSNAVDSSLLPLSMPPPMPMLSRLNSFMMDGMQQSTYTTPGAGGPGGPGGGSQIGAGGGGRTKHQRRTSAVAIVLRVTWSATSILAFVCSVINIAFVCGMADSSSPYPAPSALSYFAPPSASSFCDLALRSNSALYSATKFASFLFFFALQRAARPMAERWTGLERLVLGGTLGLLPLGAWIALLARAGNAGDGSCAMAVPLGLVVVHATLHLALASAYLWLFVHPLMLTVAHTAALRTPTALGARGVKLLRTNTNTMIMTTPGGPQAAMLLVGVPSKQLAGAGAGGGGINHQSTLKTMHTLLKQSSVASVLPTTPSIVSKFSLPNSPPSLGRHISQASAPAGSHTTPGALRRLLLVSPAPPPVRSMPAQLHIVIDPSSHLPGPNSGSVGPLSRPAFESIESSYLSPRLGSAGSPAALRAAATFSSLVKPSPLPGVSPLTLPSPLSSPLPLSAPPSPFPDGKHPATFRSALAKASSHAHRHTGSVSCVDLDRFASTRNIVSGSNANALGSASNVFASTRTDELARMISRNILCYTCVCIAQVPLFVAIIVSYTSYSNPFLAKFIGSIGSIDVSITCLALFVLMKRSARAASGSGVAQAQQSAGSSGVGLGGAGQSGAAAATGAVFVHPALSPSGGGNESMLRSVGSRSMRVSHPSSSLAAAPNSNQPLTPNSSQKMMGSSMSQQCMYAAFAAARTTIVPANASESTTIMLSPFILAPPLSPPIQLSPSAAASAAASLHVKCDSISLSDDEVKSVALPLDPTPPRTSVRLHLTPALAVVRAGSTSISKHDLYAHATTLAGSSSSSTATSKVHVVPIELHRASKSFTGATTTSSVNTIGTTRSVDDYTHRVVTFSSSSISSSRRRTASLEAALTTSATTTSTSSASSTSSSVSSPRASPMSNTLMRDVDTKHHHIVPHHTDDAQQTMVMGIETTTIEDDIQDIV